MANLNQFKPTGKLFGTHQMKIYEVQPLKILYRYSVICSILFQMFMSQKTSPFFGHPCSLLSYSPSGKGAQGKEHEDQNKQTLRQIHRRHFRRHGAHDTQGPIKAEDLQHQKGEKRRGRSTFSSFFCLGGAGVGKLTKFVAQREKIRKQIVSNPNFGVPHWLVKHLGWKTPANRHHPATIFGMLLGKGGINSIYIKFLGGKNPRLSLGSGVTLTPVGCEGFSVCGPATCQTSGTQRQRGVMKYDTNPKQCTQKRGNHGNLSKLLKYLCIKFDPPPSKKNNPNLLGGSSTVCKICKWLTTIW